MNMLKCLSIAAYLVLNSMVVNWLRYSICTKQKYIKCNIINLILNNSSVLTNIFSKEIYSNLHVKYLIYYLQ